MSQTPFDAYHELLGIAPAEQPPTLYRLLGVTPFESTASVIERAADRQLAHLRTLQVGKHQADSQRLLNEVMRAKQTLLNDEERAKYNAQLKKQLATAAQQQPAYSQQQPAYSQQQPVAKPLKIAQALPLAQVPLAKQISVAPVVAPAAPEQPLNNPLNIASQPAARSQKARKQSSNTLLIGGVVGVVLAGLAVVGVLIAMTGGNAKPTPVAQKPGLPATAPPSIPNPPPAITPKPMLPMDPPKVEPAVVTPAPEPIPPPTPTPVEPRPVENPPVAPVPVEPMPVAPALVPAPTPAPPANDFSKERAEVAAARDALQTLPKFKKFYDHLQANPDTLPINGPKLAAMLQAEVEANAAIREHAPSQLAALQEVERLATAGGDYKLALPAIDAQVNHSVPLLSINQARAAKSKLFDAAADAANKQKAKQPEREALLAAVHALLPETLQAADKETLTSLLSTNAKLNWTGAERLTSIQSLLPFVEQLVNQENTDISSVMLDHLDAQLAKSPVGKPRKDALDAITALRERLTLVAKTEAAQKTLAANPNDPAANQTMGIYLLMNRGEWRKSLSHFALTANADWKALAEQTIPAQSAAEKVALADRWAALSAEANATGKEIARRLFAEALGSSELVGIGRAAAEEKAKALGPSLVKVVPAEVASNGPPATASIPLPLPIGPSAVKKTALNQWIDLLPLVDIAQDSVAGTWSKGAKNSILVTEPKVHSRLRLPIVLTNCDYDLAAEFNVGDKSHSVHLILPVGERNVQLIVDGYGQAVSYFDLVGGKEARHHPNAVWKQLLAPNRTHRYDLSVRLNGDQAKLVFKLNGEQKFEYAGPIAELNVRDMTSIGTAAQPALAVSDNTAEFVSCQVRTVRGEPKLLRGGEESPAAAKPMRANR